MEPPTIKELKAALDALNRFVQYLEQLGPIFGPTEQSAVPSRGRPASASKKYGESRVRHAHIQRDIVRLLRETGRELTARELIADFAALRGVRSDDARLWQAVRNALTRLKRAGRLHREGGKYSVRILKNATDAVTSVK